MIAEAKTKRVDIPDQPFTKEAIIARNHSRLGKYDVVPHDALPPTLLTPNFQAIMEVLYDDKKIPDSFGLCGVIALYTLLHSHPKFQDISFDLVEYYAAYQRGESASALFKAQVANNFLLTDIDQRAVTSTSDLQNILSEIATNNSVQPTTAMMVAYLCEYPNQAGQHTHWLFAQQSDETTAIVGGDMRPFGLKDYLIGMSIKNLASGIIPTVGAISTASLPSSVIHDSVRDGDMSAANTIQTNVSIKHYLT